MATIEQLLNGIEIHENYLEYSPALKGIVISDSLSPSGVNDFADGCVSKKLIERMLQKAEGSVLDIMSPAYIGTATHAVLEVLMQLPPKKRTKDQLSPIYTKLVRQHKIEEPDNDEDLEKFRNDVLSLSEGLFALEDPTAVNVFGTEQFFELSLWGVPMRGVIDRIDELSDGTLAVVDYKSGKYRAPNPRFGDNYTPQLVIYAMAVEQLTGKTVSIAYDAFVAVNKTHEVKLNEGQKQKVKELVLEAWSTIEDVQETRTATYKASALCAWCPMAAHCPEAIKKGVEPVTVNGLALAQIPVKSDFAITVVDTDTSNLVTPYAEGKQWIPFMDDGSINYGSTHARNMAQVVQEAEHLLRTARPVKDANQEAKRLAAMTTLLVSTITQVASASVNGKVTMGHSRWMQVFWTLRSWSYRNPVDFTDVASWRQRAVKEVGELMKLSADILVDDKTFL
jgi:RecB family exonuclease